MDTRNTTPVRQDVRELTAAEIEAVAGGTGNGIGNTVVVHNGNGGTGGSALIGGVGGAGGMGGGGFYGSKGGVGGAGGAGLF